MEEKSHQDKKVYTRISGKKLIFLLVILVMTLSAGGGFVYYKSLQNAIQIARSAFAEECTNVINNSRSSFTNYEKSTYKPEYVTRKNINPSTALNSLKNSITSIKNLAEINSKYIGASEALKSIDSLNLKLGTFQDIKSKELKIEANNPHKKELEASQKLAEDALFSEDSFVASKKAFEENFDKTFADTLDYFDLIIELEKVITKNDISWNLYMGKNFNSNDRKLFQESNRQVQEEYENLNNICRNAKE